MKILHIGKFFPPAVGGIESVIGDLVCGLRSVNVAADALCCNGTAKTTSEFIDNAKVTRAAMLTKLAATAISPAMIMELARQWRSYDIIHLHVPDPMACLAIWLVRPNTRLVVHWHSDVVNKGWLMHLFAPLQQWILTRADAIVTTSEIYSKESRWLRKFQNKIEVIPIGIPRPAHNNGASSPLTTELQLPGLPTPDAKFVVLAVGRAVEQKGFHVLIQAIADLPEHFEAWIVGDGPFLNSLQTLSSKYKITHRVKFFGRLDRTQIGALYSKASVFCLPAVYPESFGVVIVEAMAHGLPVITTTTVPSGSKWINQHGETGYNVVPADAAALAEALRELASDDILRAQMGNKARARFEDFFTDKRMVDLTIDLYKKICPAKNRDSSRTSSAQQN